MRALKITPLLLLLLGCRPQAEKATPVDTGPGRWMVISASGAETKRAGFEASSAWRLDTKTGDLEFCTYWLLGAGGRPIESIDCTAPAKAHPSDLKIRYYDAKGRRLTAPPPRR